MRFAKIFSLYLGVVAAAAAQVGNNQGLVDANLADGETLRSLPHVTDALAGAMQEGRPFLNATALNEVVAGSLNEAERTELYGHLFRQINLNTASEDEIMLIPGMTARMAHEFEEYRPYTSLEQFRREIGKYVDENEVARLEQYVFVPMSLNTASSEDFMTIPGMTARMVHEFEEYRPYTSIEQFRREIGKYVDENEVARLESYVTLD
ncbi:MAG TPA: helix-hairpin-helix domain-containing protein [Gammaproteobacteria bacterium]|jgi:DNA uptake protein ComE-like DNA-binding protein